MTDPKRPRYTTDFTQKIRLCRGCHNELPPDVEVCPICRTRIGSDPGEPADGGEERTKTHGDGAPPGPEDDRDPFNKP